LPEPGVEAELPKKRAARMLAGHMRTLSAIFLRSVIVISMSLSSAWAGGFTVEQVLSAPFPSQLTAATKAPVVVWVFDRRGERNVWLWEAARPGAPARAVTRYQGDEGQPIASLRITADGKTVVYVRGAEANPAGVFANPASVVGGVKQQVWAMSVEGTGEPRRLGDMQCGEEGCEDVQLSPDGTQAVWATKKTLWLAPVAGDQAARALHQLQGVSESPRWSPDGKRIAFVLRRGDHSFVAVLDMAAETVWYLAPSVDRDFAPRWSRDGKRIAFLRIAGREAKLPLIPLRPRPWAIWVADAATGQAREIWHSGAGPDDSLPHFAEEAFFFAGQDRIVFESEQDGRGHLYSIAATGGAVTRLTSGEFEIEDVTLSPDGQTVVYSSNQHGADPGDEDRRHLWSVSVTGGAAKALTQGANMQWKPVFSGDGRSLYCLGATATTPATVYQAEGGELRPLAKETIPAEFPAAELVTPKQVTFRSEDGLTIHAQLFEAKGRSKPGPAILFTHGGPPRQMMLGFHYMYYYHNAYAANQYLASLGYTVLSVNYRLGIMYGRRFREPADGGWRGSSEYKDVLAGYRYLASLPTVDKDRVGLWGGSYGGLLTALGLARNSDLFKAGVDFHGVHDWSMFLSEWEENPAQAPDYKEAVKLAWESSPNASVETWRSPVLLIHGDDDRNVPFPQTTDLVQRLRRQKVEFEQMVFPDEIHDFLLWRHWVKAYTAMGEFFQRKLPVEK
jgi:dipeptidyl aminopeptidase/acylaminoacyl peptidase